MNKEEIRAFGRVIGWTCVWSGVGMMVVIALLFICAAVGWLCAHHPMIFLFTALLILVSGASWFCMWKTYIYMPKMEKIYKERGYRPTEDPDWVMR